MQDVKLEADVSDKKTGGREKERKRQIHRTIGKVLRSCNITMTESVKREDEIFVRLQKTADIVERKGPREEDGLTETRY